MTSEPPTRLLFINAHVYTPDQVYQPGWLLTDGSRIRLIGPGQPPPSLDGTATRIIDASGLHLLPGFIDLHAHGACGCDAMDASPAALHTIAQFYAQHGVTSFLPTTWTASHDDTSRALDVITELTGRVPGGATILGAHMEGPYLNASKCGAQAPQHIRRADPAEVIALLDENHIKLVALAPEFPENLWLIDECVRRGITVSAAHTAATYQQMLTAVEHGLRQATHTFNAMTGLGHREPGTVGAVLTSDHIRAELIADNIHVHPAAMKVLVKVKGPDRVILVTDAIRGAGMPDGEYRVDQRAIAVRDGTARLPDGTLAGSVLTMERALRNIMTATGLPLREAWPMTSWNAAKSIGVAQTKGSLESGKDADLVLLNSSLTLVMTVVEGDIVHEVSSDRPVLAAI
ncbi:MAG: N-acetylglucosamine-6-phosphate deacetylase [Chloroflexi bacterium]|nr:N-acetylglucosamine-6-phosphate deacetylase [Chloroflexota bacterium]